MFVSVYPSKIGIYQKKKMSSFTIQDFWLGHFPQKKTPKNASHQTPNQPSPDPFPPRKLPPTPSLRIFHWVPRTQFPWTNELPRKDLPG